MTTTTTTTSMIQLPVTDRRRYHHFRLKQNGLRCLIISDPSADKSAASLACRVGQMQDPDNLPGLAHLTEHMMSMGSQKFPDEQEYEKYLSMSGGHANAYTDLELTCYYLDCSASKLQGALERMGAAFSHPLLLQKSLQREILAVDSEHGKNRHQDYWRWHQLSRTLMCTGASNSNSNNNNNANIDDTTTTTACSHPYGQFGTGDCSTLLPGRRKSNLKEQQEDGENVAFNAEATNSDNNGGEEKEKEEEEDEEHMAKLRQAVWDFFCRYYKADKMTLVVLGSESVEQLQVWVETNFCDVPKMNNNDDDNIVATTTKAYDKNEDIAAPLLPPLEPHHLPLRVHVIPIREGRFLELQWPVQPVLENYRSKPARYISHLLGHEGPGSLLDCLRRKQWAQELSSDDVSTSCTTFLIFKLQLELTEEGFAHVDEIVGMVYRYLELILEADIPAWVYDELKTVADMQFRFLSMRQSSDTCSSLATQMLLLAGKPEKYFSGAYLLFDEVADREAISSILKSMRPDNMLMILSAPDFDDGDQNSGKTVDPHYGTCYELVDISPTLLEQWKAAAANAAASTDESFSMHLPERNDMLATNFDLVSADPAVFVREGYETLHPRCIQDDGICRLWYKPDTTFDMPKVNLMVLVRTASAYEAGPKEAVLASLWSEVVHELCNPFSYAASQAGLHCDFGNNRAGLEIHLSGYNDKASVLLQRIMNVIANMAVCSGSKSSAQEEEKGAAESESVSPDLFSRIKDKIEKQFLAFMVAQPYQHAIYAADLCLELPKWSIQDRLKCLQEDVTLEDFVHFSRQIFKRCQLEVLVHGNVTQDQAKEFSTILLDSLQPKPPFHFPLSRVVNLAATSRDGSNCKTFIHRLAGWNEQDTNNCLLNIYQMGILDDRNRAILLLAHQTMQEPAFHQLRTVEQLGYIVHTSTKNNGEGENSVKGLLILIQSDAYDPVHMDGSVENFLIQMRHNLVGMSKEDFDSHKQAARQLLLEKNKNLSEETGKHWQVVVNQTYRFHRLEELAEHVDKIGKVDVLRFWDRFLGAKSPGRRKLSVQVFGTNHREKFEECAADAQTNNSDPATTYIQDPAEFTQGQSLFPAKATTSIDHLKL